MSVNGLQRCSIPGCKMTNITHKLYKFPLAIGKVTLWRTAIRKTFPNFKMHQDSEGRCQQYVCRLHFEDKYIDPEGTRKCMAFPTLFSWKEIKRGKPKKPVSLDTTMRDEFDVLVRGVYDPLSDLRRTAMPVHFVLDHTYSSAVVVTGLEGPQPPEDPPSEIIKSEPSHCSEQELPRNVDCEDADDLDRTEPCPFSWQNSSEICVEDHYLNTVPFFMDVTEEQKTNSNRDQIGGEAKDVATHSTTHREYYCDSCTNEIIGFRYTCVQCENFDLCSTCEMKMVHPQHYMLRVPTPRPFDEIRSFIEMIREKIKVISDSGQIGIEGVDEIKQEVEETEETQLGESMQEESDTRAKLPVDMLAHRHQQDVWRTDQDEKHQAQNVPDVLNPKEVKTVVSENEEWLDDAVLEHSENGDGSDACADAEVCKTELTRRDVTQNVSASDTDSITSEQTDDIPLAQWSDDIQQKPSPSEHHENTPPSDQSDEESVASDFIPLTKWRHRENTTSTRILRSSRNHESKAPVPSNDNDQESENIPVIKWSDLVNCGEKPATKRKLPTIAHNPRSKPKLNVVYQEIDSEMERFVNEIWLNESTESIEDGHALRSDVKRKEKRTKVDTEFEQVINEILDLTGDEINPKPVAGQRNILLSGSNPDKPKKMQEVLENIWLKHVDDIDNLNFGDKRTKPRGVVLHIKSVVKKGLGCKK